VFKVFNIKISDQSLILKNFLKRLNHYQRLFVEGLWMIISINYINRMISNFCHMLIMVLTHILIVLQVGKMTEGCFQRVAVERSLQDVTTVKCCHQVLLDN